MERSYLRIEEKDKLSKTNYHEVALKRELFEEFNGTFPNAIKEEGKTDSLIEFFEIKAAYKLLNNKSAIKTLDLIVKNIK